jgi:hypothetical protein
MMREKDGQMDLPFDSRVGEPSPADAPVASLTARIEAARSAEKRKLYRAILSRAAHLLDQGPAKPPDDAG